MVDVARSVLVAHSAEDMYALVEGVERYPDFLPWCSGASVAYRDDTRMLATIDIHYRGISQSFTTDTVKERGRTLRITLVRGPFKRLDGSWAFMPLAQVGCKVEFHLHYEFSSRIMERLVGPVFHYIANTMVDAFVRRAQTIHGAR